MHIRPICSHDRDEWLRLLAGLYAGSSDSDHLAPVDAFLSRTAHPELLPAAVFVCDRGDGRLAGFLELSVRTYAEGCSGPAPYVESWFVDPDVRGRGIGRRLMTAAEEWAKTNGYGELASDTELENDASQCAHRALGFEIVERAVHFRKKL